jgi:hypothetical protein
MLFGGLESLTIGWLPTFMLSAKNAKKRPTIVEIKKEERKETSLSSLLCVLCAVFHNIVCRVINDSSKLRTNRLLEWRFWVDEGS